MTTYQNDKGFVQTPKHKAREIIQIVEQHQTFTNSSVLIPGIGTGVFAEQIVNTFNPELIIGIEKYKDILSSVDHSDEIQLIQSDFLYHTVKNEKFDIVISNPPYVNVSQLDEKLKQHYVENFDSTKGKYDLYMLFIEQSIRKLRKGGIGAFLIPEKYTYTNSGEELRKLLTDYDIKRIEHYKEEIFPNNVTYPSLLLIQKQKCNTPTKVILRTGERKNIHLPTDGSSWASKIRGEVDINGDITLSEITKQISSGVITGCDDVFIHEEKPDNLPDSLICKSISGSCLTSDMVEMEYIVTPYDKRGNVVTGELFEQYIEWLSSHREILESRSCTEKNKKKWYEWQWVPDMKQIQENKIICPDITKEPMFYFDDNGVIPQHNTYYIVPYNTVPLELYQYLCSREVSEWLKSNAQKAKNGYYRLQTNTLKDLPVHTRLEIISQTRIDEY